MNTGAGGGEATLAAFADGGDAASPTVELDAASTEAAKVTSAVVKSCNADGDAKWVLGGVDADLYVTAGATPSNADAAG